METAHCTTRKHGLEEIVAKVKFRMPFALFAVKHLPVMADKISPATGRGKMKYPGNSAQVFLVLQHEREKGRVPVKFLCFVSRRYEAAC